MEVDKDRRVLATIYQSSSPLNQLKEYQSVWVSLVLGPVLFLGELSGRAGDTISLALRDECYPITDTICFTAQLTSQAPVATPPLTTTNDHTITLGNLWALNHHRNVVIKDHGAGEPQISTLRNVLIFSLLVVALINMPRKQRRIYMFR
jgi:hypothetical protein